MKGPLGAVRGTARLFIKSGLTIVGGKAQQESRQHTLPKSSLRKVDSITQMVAVLAVTSGSLEKRCL